MQDTRQESTDMSFHCIHVPRFAHSVHPSIHNDANDRQHHANTRRVVLRVASLDTSSSLRQKAWLLKETHHAATPYPHSWLCTGQLPRLSRSLIHPWRSPLSPPTGSALSTTDLASRCRRRTLHRCSRQCCCCLHLCPQSSSCFLSAATPPCRRCGGGGTGGAARRPSCRRSTSSAPPRGSQMSSGCLVRRPGLWKH